MSEKVIVADVSECQLCVRCPKCKSSIVFDFSLKNKQDDKPLAVKTLEMCPACGETTGHDSHVDEGNPIGAYRAFLRLVEGSRGFTYQFLVPLDDD